MDIGSLLTLPDWVRILAVPLLFALGIFGPLFWLKQRRRESGPRRSRYGDADRPQPH